MPSLSNVRFPVVRSVEINGYALFPGAAGTGLSHTFKSGVSIIAGINGLGKTTLLNALVRVLIGPSDVIRETPEDVGSTRHELMGWRTPGLFRDRVPDDAASATITTRISFGTDVIYVERSLRDLSVLQLLRDDDRLEPSEAAFQQLVVELSGVDTFYDFHFLARNLVFYLEDRRPLLWSDDGQFEIARILFIPGAQATEFSTVYDEIKSLDSRYRSLNTETNRTVKRLNEQRRAEGEKASNVAKIAALRDAYQGGQAALERVETELDLAIDEERKVADEIRRAQLEHESAYRDYEGLQLSYFARAFGDRSEKLQYMLSHIIAGGGCLLCGSEAEAKEAQLREQVARGECPLCDSPPQAQEGVVAAPEVAAERVNRAAEDLGKLERGMISQSEAHKALTSRVGELLRERGELSRLLDRQRSDLAVLGGRLPSAGSELSELEASVKVNQEQVAALLKDRSERIVHYRSMMAGVSSRIEAAHLEVKRHFQDYVKSFLAETCELNFRTRRRPIGESGQTVEFPGFDVMMTSGVFRDQPRPRLTRNDISESQKEFIDLAFRMALIRTAAPAEAGAMLVLETPEASLDSLFIYRAGDLLRSFAEGGGEVGNVLIASSNLNSANMIPALLGIDREPQRGAETEARMINLLEGAASNAAMELQGDQYWLQYRSATAPDPARLPPEGVPPGGGNDAHGSDAGA